MTLKNASDFIFNLREPDITVSQAGESAIREVMGQNTMDFIITEGRTKVAEDTKGLLQTVLDSYGAGVNVPILNSVLEAQPPEQVQDAFSDAIRLVRMSKDINMKLKLIETKLYHWLVVKLNKCLNKLLHIK